MPGQNGTVERIIARIATAAHGVVTRKELLEARVSESQIEHRLDTGALIRQYPGVYRAGHCAPSTEALYMAAVKACGKGSALSGRAAAYMLGLVRGSPPPPEVTARNERTIDGLETRRSHDIHRRDAWIFIGIRVTTVARTLVDLAGRIPEEELALACHEAGGKYRTTPRQVEAVLDRRPTSPGAAKLRRIMGGDTRVSLSALERKFLQRLREAGLPLPDQTNKKAGSKRVDCRWLQQKLTVELDSYRFHNSRHAFEQDRKREREAYRRGDDHRRYTWGDVFEHPAQMLAELRALLTP